MRTIGITGGVGAGKSAILAYLKEHYSCRILMADQVAGRLEEPGQKCYEDIVCLLGKAVLWADGSLNREAMAQRIFQDGALLEKVNQIVHPAVQEYIENAIDEEKKLKRYDFFFVEAALLIECGYDRILDELWYIYAEEKVRRERLRKARAYSEEKIDHIMSEQLTEEIFRKKCHFTVDNSGALEAACRQIDKRLGERTCQK